MDLNVPNVGVVGVILTEGRKAGRFMSLKLASPIGRLRCLMLLIAFLLQTFYKLLHTYPQEIPMDGHQRTVIVK